MDDILDLMQDSAESMHLFDIQTCRPRRCAWRNCSMRAASG